MQNPILQEVILSVEVVFHPSLWLKHTGITYDEDFLLSIKRVEPEKKSEHILEKLKIRLILTQGIGKNGF